VRKIKFRAWCTGMDAMRYSDDENDSSLHMFFGNSDKCCTIMQYVGLKEKKGKEIYEGDIIDYKEYASDWSEDDPEYGCIAWDEKTAKYYITEIEHFQFIASFAHPMWESCVVVGNKYENPELLRERNHNGKA